MKQKAKLIGNSLYVRIPLDFRRDKGIERDSMIDVREDPDGNLVLIPVGDEPVE